MSDEIDLVLGVDFTPGPRLVEIVTTSLHREEYGLWWLSTGHEGHEGHDFFGSKRRRQARCRRMARKRRRGWA